MGATDGPARNEGSGLTIGNVTPSGFDWIADHHGHVIARMASDGQFSEVAGFVSEAECRRQCAEAWRDGYIGRQADGLTGKYSGNPFHDAKQDQTVCTICGASSAEGHECRSTDAPK